MDASNKSNQSDSTPERLHHVLQIVEKHIANRQWEQPNCPFSEQEYREARGGLRALLDPSLPDNNPVGDIP